MGANGNDPTYVTNVEVARAMIRGKSGDVESPMSAREQRRLQQRRQESQADMSGVVLHTPEQVGDMHCRRLWGVLGTAGEPVVHYCVAETRLAPVTVLEPLPFGIEHKRMSELRREHADGQHRCGCGASTHEQGARLICRFRESGQDPCARVIESVEQMPAGQRSMPCGHPVVAVGRHGRTVNGNRKRKK